MEFLIRLDTSLFFFFNTKIANPVFDWIMPIITNQWVWAIPILLCWFGMIIFGGKKARIAAVIILIATGSSDAICYRVIKPTVKRIRPSHQFADARLLVGKGGKYSFPSNHAANITTAMCLLAYFFRRPKYWFALIALSISFSRIYVGVHFPFDVAAGMTLGVAFASFWIMAWMLLAKTLEKRGYHFLSIAEQNSKTEGKP